MTPFAGWVNFYVIVGSSAGALIGLQFVVITLIGNMPISTVDRRVVDAFGTPTIVHFGFVLLTAAMLSAPWHESMLPLLLLGVAGLGGVLYTFFVVRHLRAQSSYQPVWEDWLFYILLPLLAYVSLSVSGYAARKHFREALFGVAATTLLLLFVGIHNAWDSITHAALVKKAKEQEAERNHEADSQSSPAA